MRPVHNTPIPDDFEFPIPDDCSCDCTTKVWTPCPACQAVIDEDAKAQAEDKKALQSLTNFIVKGNGF